MTDSHFRSSSRLFYSYSHKDIAFRERMQTALALLKNNKLLHDWSDHEILPGRHISPRVRQEMDKATIIAFLFSPDFIHSSECRREWDYAASLASDEKFIFRVPIIVRPCSWHDFLGVDDVKALPHDGKPVASYSSDDEAWQEVYDGIKDIIIHCASTFTAKVTFLSKIDKSEFLSQDHLNLQDLFTFPHLTCHEPTGSGQSPQELLISTHQRLLANKRALVYGQENTGKTALARHLYLNLLDESKPALLIDLTHAQGRLNESFLSHHYQEQFHGDYSMWIQQENKTLILDNMTDSPRLLELVDRVVKIFDRVIITMPSDVFYAFFKDEERLADFKQIKIEPLTHGQQEKLIRKRLALSNDSKLVSDGYVNQIEKRVNSVIISNKILPRYPFYVLSILQTYEDYMPANMSITSYGHCYYALIVANLIRSGISKADDSINACFNFAEQLAFATCLHLRQHKETTIDFRSFVTRYKERFHIKDSLINRLKLQPYGLIDASGRVQD